MKAAFFLAALPNGAKRMAMGLILAVAVIFSPQNATATTIDLGMASSFAVLAGSAITGGNSTITGDVGLSPAAGTLITVITPGQVNGTIYAVDATGPAGSAGNNPGLLTTAQHDLLIAYNLAALQSASTVPTELGGTTLPPGVYVSDSGTFGITHTLTLSGDGLYIFKMATTLTTAAGAPQAPGSIVNLINGASACNVFWQVGSSATIGTYSAFEGNILALTDITVNTDATVDGRVLALNGAVTLDTDTITENCTVNGVPDTGSTLLLLSSGLAALLAFRRRFFSPA